SVSIAQGRVRAPVVAVAQPADQTSGSGNIGHVVDLRSGKREASLESDRDGPAPLDGVSRPSRNRATSPRGARTPVRRLEIIDRRAERTQRHLARGHVWLRL